ncbi:gliding motility-associated C-terminal domain-containing protein [Carboxylicivirga taeanensis]|uniref:T9SS type B sorting domain-containing protein n=1 Tax=Carboxylicivirga taeanensis TaxID=1416875 RepID=UPI003F6E3FF2
MRIFTAIFLLYLTFSFSLKGQEDVYAYDDKIKGLENTQKNIPVLNNDFGLLSGVTSLIIVDEASNGVAVVESDHTITFTPDRSFVGTDKFVYEVCNVDGKCGKATVFVEIEDFDFIPEAVNDSITYLHGNAMVIDFLSNDTIDGDDPVTITLLGELAQGECYLNGNNELEVEFERRFVGKDSLDYIICDIDNDCSQARMYFDVRHGGDIDFYIPEGFSPNGDGINDRFYIPDFSTYEGIRIVIVDSWGSVVYENNNYQNDWNGIANAGASNGKLVSSGTYYYIISVDGISDRITGFVYVAK